MLAIEHIRRNIFAVTQSELAEIAHTTQATVSRWESGEWSPSLDELDLIRTEAKRRGLAWDDSLFFTAPDPAPAGGQP